MASTYSTFLQGAGVVNGSRGDETGIFRTCSLRSFVQGKVVDRGVGNEKFKADKQQLGGLLMTVSICATFFPLGRSAGVSGGMVTAGDNTGLPCVFTHLCLVSIGITGMTTAYLSLVNDWGNKPLSASLPMLVQMTWIPYITDMVYIGRMAGTGQAFVPGIYSPNREDVGFVGAVGIVGILTFGVCFIGSLTFLSSSLYAYQVGKPGDRSAPYYQRRLLLCSIVVTVAGMAQVMLGAYIISNFGAGPLPEPIEVAMFTISFPEITVFVGIVYLLNGLHGAFRSVLSSKVEVNDTTFQSGMWFQYACTLILTILVQISYADADMVGVAAPSRTALAVGVCLLPAYLDYKARKTPHVLPENFFGILQSMEEIVEEEETESIEQESVGDISYEC